MGVRGSCLCGDVVFEVDAPFQRAGHCHCSMCRKHHGTAFTSFVVTEAEGIRWLRGAEGIRTYRSSPKGERTFCGRCGSKTPHPRRTRGSAGVSTGLLEGDPGVRPQLHMMVGSKAPWHEIHDALPRHEACPPGRGEAVAYARPTEPAAGNVRGSCLCGAVAYEIDAPVAEPIYNCHCSRCRRARASAHSSMLALDLERFRWLRGEGELVAYKLPEAERFGHTFCARCGSSAPSVRPALGRVGVPAGTLDDDPGVREAMHIFVGSKAPWYEIADALPQHAEYPPGGPPALRPR